MSDDTERALDLYHQAIWKHFGEEPDLQAAIALYRESADLGFAPAQTNLGYCYKRGTGVEQSDAIALYWATRAVERGEPTAYLSVATLLFKTATDESTLVEALKYALLAKTLLNNGGNKDLANVYVGLISAKLSPESMAKVYELTSKWESLVQPEFVQNDSPVFTPLDKDDENNLSDQGGGT